MKKILYLIFGLLLLTGTAAATVVNWGGNTYTGLASDTKPANAAAGSRFFETDSPYGAYIKSGATWTLMSAESDISSHTSATVSVHGFDALGNAPAQTHDNARHSPEFATVSDIATDANLSQNVQDNINLYLRNILSTSLLGGGLITINTDTTKFDIAAGSGIVVNNYTDPLNPSLTYVTWDQATAIVSPYLNTDTTTYVYVTSAGTFTYSPDWLTAEGRRDLIVLGWVDHSDLTYISEARLEPMVNADLQAQLNDFLESFGAFNIEGNIYSALSVSTIQRSAGTTFDNNTNYYTTKKSPHILTTDSESPASIYYYYRDGTGDWINDLDATLYIDSNYWDDGSGTPQAVSAGKFTIQVIAFYSNFLSNDIQYGQVEYDSMAAAEAALQAAIEIDPYNAYDTFRCHLIVKQGADLTNPAEAKFVEIGRFGLGTGAGGSGGAPPGDTVVSETSYGQSATAGTALEHSRRDHTHGTPAHELPAGGTTGQILSKATDTSYEVAWTSPAGGGNVTTSTGAQWYLPVFTTSTNIGVLSSLGASGAPLVSAGAGANPDWAAFTFSGTAAQTYTFPTTSKTLMANDYSNAGTAPTWNQDTTGSAAKWTTSRSLAGNSVDGSANVAFTNSFIIAGTADAGLTGAGRQFLGALNTGIVKNTTTTGVLSIAAAGDFPTLNQDTTGMAGSLKSPATTGKTTITGPTAGTTRAKTARDADDTLLELGGSYTPTGTWNWGTASVTWPTFNQNTTGSAAQWTTARNLAGNSVNGSANVAFANKFIVQGTADTGLSGPQFLGALGTGIVKNTTTTGVLSIAAAGTDYQAPLTNPLVAGTLVNGQYCTKNAGANTIDCNSSGGSGYATIQEEGSGLTQRAILNFAGAGVTCADDTTRTTCTVPGGGSTTFDAIGSGTNTTMTGTVGSGAKLVTTGTGTIQASVLSSSTGTYVLTFDAANSINGLLKSSATGTISVASSGTDYGPPTSGNATGLVLSTTGTGAHTAYTGTSCTNQFARSLNASGAATCAGIGVADFTANQGTTTQVLHGNASGQPSWGAVSTSDLPTVPVTKGGSNLTTVASNQVYVGTSTDTLTAKTLPSCSNATTSKLLYDNSTQTFSCGTDQTGGGTPAGILEDIQFSVLQADGTLNAASGVQTWAGTNGTAQDVFAVDANSTYRVRGQWIVNTGATTHTTAIAWALSTATATSWQYLVTLWSAAANTISTTQSTTHVSGVASKVLNTTSTSVYTIIKFEGILVIATGGTITPQINFSANPTGTNLMKRGSFVQFTKLGTDTVVETGGWQ